jgi:glyoxylase-like metal-dependent hydrolase (beta-lactamase superfamily II)
VINAPHHVRDLLIETGVIRLEENNVEAVIWSHGHFDHVGDPATFPQGDTMLVVGPGFKRNLMPGYPSDPQGSIVQSDYMGRELLEISFDDYDCLRIGRFRAFDFFGDGSFYLLDAPGHAIGHLCALARVQSSPDAFILMAGDSWHHGGELRPSKWLTLPDRVAIPVKGRNGASTPENEKTPEEKLIWVAAEAFVGLLPEGDRSRPFYLPARLDQGQVHHDIEETIRTIEKIQEFDAMDNVLVVAAHDESLLGVLDFFPESANDFVKKRWVEKTRWRFLKDFSGAIDLQAH